MPPKKNSTVFNLDAAIKEAASEGTDEQEFRFTFADREWTMRPASQSDARLLANIELNETQQVMAYMRDLLGDQWDEFPRISFSGAMLLIEKYSEFTQGVPVGESEASTES